MYSRLGKRVAVQVPPPSSWMPKKHPSDGFPRRMCLKTTSWREARFRIWHTVLCGVKRKEFALNESSSRPTLSEQVALVTGAGRGIGGAIAAKLASLGARVILCGRQREPLEQTSQSIHNRGGQSSVKECGVATL